MDHCEERIPGFDSNSDAAKTLSPGKFTGFPIQEQQSEVMFGDIKLELESAQLELEAAEAMKRAAEAKRRAAAAIRREREVNSNEDGGLSLDSQVHIRLPVLDTSGQSTPAVNPKVELKSELREEVNLKQSVGVCEMDMLMARLELPKCEIPYFDGSPLQYILFFRQFEEQVETRVKDDRQRLTFLYHYCQGKAKEAIRGCLLYPSEEGYKRARGLLKELFGRRHLIVRAMLDEVTKPGLIPADADSLSSYANQLVNCADALEQLGYTADLNSVGTIERVLNKLPRFMTIDWVKRAEEIDQSDREPVFRDLCEFVCSKARLLRNRYSHLLQERKIVATAPVKEVTQRRTYVVSVSDNVCAQCQERHCLGECSKFKALSVKDRWALVTRAKVCFVCLRFGHRAEKCLDKVPCIVEGCNRLHHSLLHQSDGKSRVLSASCQMFPNARGVSLGIIPVIAEGPQGSVLASALLDTGADTSLVCDDLAWKLGLKGESNNVHMNTPIGSMVRHCTRVSFRVKALDGSELIEVNGAYTVPSVLDVDANLPSKQVLAKWSHLEGISFTPLPSPVVSILIGLDTPEAHWILEQKRGKKGDPYADRTPLGWVLRGPIDQSHTGGIRTFAIHAGLREIETNLHKFYDQEFVEDDPFRTSPSMEDELAVDILEKSLEVRGEHLSVGLPWKDNTLEKHCNRPAAYNRLILLGKRFRKDVEFQMRYSAVIDRYLQRGYAIPVPEGVCESGCVQWYLPHHAVINPKKPDKVRVVFDCAAKFNGESLNDHLLQGPNLVSSLVGVLLRFRQKPVALSADIEDMFLQVLVPERDQNALRFLWWPEGDISRSPKEFRLTVHPFGAVSSPFCASFALKKTATIFGHDYPLVVTQTVMSSFYVDDCLVSVNDETEAASLVEGLRDLLKRSGFRLTKWLSNSRSVLSQIPEGERNSAVKNINVGSLPTQRTLGLEWEVESDSFKYQVQLADPPPTRRVLLSQLATIFDPLGWLGPYILPLKALFQQLCKQEIGWDQPLGTDVITQWQQCNRVLNNIPEIRIPRWYANGVTGAYTEAELHLFCDASNVGYGAVAYLRFVGSISPSCALVMAKSRVAPLKTVTIPRLELAAAVLAVELAEMIKREVEIPFREINFWTDSAVVLYYIRNDKGRFATFVANRVSKIRQCSLPTQWRHVAGKDNPADLASRGMRLHDHDEQLWFNGPEFLRASTYITPSVEGELLVPDELLEFKTKATVNSLSGVPCLSLFGRFSSWIKLLKCVAWILRFKQYLLVRARGVPGMSLRLGRLTVQDLKDSCHEIVKVVQRESFPQELDYLRKDSTCHKSNARCNRLRKLCPVLINGMLCVGGRLQWSDLSDTAKHPIILPPKHVVTKLIIENYHELEGHVGSTQVLSTIRRKFWIVQGRAAVRRVLSTCLRCRKESVRPCCQLMAPVPKERTIEVGYAFAHVGVDYFGPVYVKRGRVEEKRYGCLFTCLNIRAVHIEVTHSLSTDAFLQALMRFMARRGQPKIIFSDNGSNFKGAYTELRTSLQSISQSKVNAFLVEREIEWKFGPPEASHWGGIWERMIRTVRRVLRAVSQGQSMTDETLLTFMAEVERIINNRPLLPLTEDANDLEALTPNRLLLLRDNETMLDHADFPRSCIRLWRRVQVLADTFWKRWKTEYVSGLQERHKWLKLSRNIVPGDLVLVISEGFHRNHWPLGVVEEVFPSADGLVREVLVRTARGSMRRDVRKLCLLEGVNS